MQKNSMRYFFVRLLWVASPLIVWQVIELFVLPTNFFTFRSWEATRVQNYGLFKGPFYPNQDIAMWSVGDLNPRGPRTRFVHFCTDDHGYRNQRPYDSEARYDFLLVGDSQFAAPNLDDWDTLGYVLEREHGKTAYNYASGWPLCQSFINDERIRSNPPRFVVLDFRPEEAIFARYASWPRCIPVNDSLQAMLCEPVPLWHRLLYRITNDDFRVVYDRASRQLGYNFLRARMNLSLRKTLPGLTLQQAEDNVHKFIAAMESLQNELRSRGMTLLLVLVPDRFQGSVGDYVAAYLSPRVPLVHWQASSPYRGELTNAPFFDDDDSHMSKYGVLKTAARIVEMAEGR